LCFIAHLYKANGGTDMEVLGLFRPCFFKGTETRYALTGVFPF